MQLRIEENLMDCDLLLSWMTHIREGSWSSFKNAVEELASSDVDLPKLCHTLRFRFSDLGIASFFLNETQRWRVLPTVLGNLAEPKGSVALYGGRTPLLVESIKNAAELHGCRIEIEKPFGCPTLIRIAGDIDPIETIASISNLRYAQDYLIKMAKAIPPIPEKLQLAPEENVPRNWNIRSFSLKKQSWEDKFLQNSACEFTPTHGRPKYFLHRKHGRLLRLSKREAVYAAAMLKGAQLIDYKSTNMQLSVPVSAPLPQLYSRLACCCSGQPAEFFNGKFIYKNVTPKLATLLIVATGQPFPNMTALTIGAR